MNYGNLHLEVVELNGKAADCQHVDAWNRWPVDPELMD